MLVERPAVAFNRDPPEGQRTIARYKINGQQLFYPNANHPAACDRKAALDYHPATNPAKG
jgi:hypothetical protein